MKTATPKPTVTICTPKLTKTVVCEAVWRPKVEKSRFLGAEINHQYSKTFAFETAMREYARTYLAPDISFFSILRPLFDERDRFVAGVEPRPVLVAELGGDEVHAHRPRFAVAQGGDDDTDN